MKRRDRKSVLNIVKAVYPMLLYLLIIQVTAIIIALVYVVAIGRGSLNNLAEVLSKYSLFINLCSAAVMLPVLLIIKYFDSKDQKSKGVKGYKRVNPLLYIFIVPFSIAFMFAANYLVSFMEKIFPFMAHSYDQVAETIYSSNIFVQIVYVIFLGPIVEELIFRGVLYTRLKRMFGLWAAAITASVLFGIFHGNISQGIYAFLFSMALIFVYEKYKKIEAPIIFHMVGNSMGVLVTYLAKDYNNQSEGSVPIFSLIILITVFSLISLGLGSCISKWVKPQKR